ncbi:hypothetical protein FHX46_003229 [Amycolatopsis viridis]|uniref:Uncharacterized protein n=1 Tax=Amycolatopsis viridis TaxID=185678 RepID=A0ABX0SYI4_9PSEU|nr:hypothetical protein [Amycolatopsis viridis]
MAFTEKKLPLDQEGRNPHETVKANRPETSIKVLDRMEVGGLYWLPTDALSTAPPRECRRSFCCYGKTTSGQSTWEHTEAFTSRSASTAL